MSKELRIFLIILGISISFIPMILSEKVIVGEQLCVDGNDNINLEGFMCEETNYQIKGLSSFQTSLIAIPSIAIGTLIVAITLFTNIGDGEK